MSDGLFNRKSFSKDEVIDRPKGYSRRSFLRYSGSLSCLTFLSGCSVSRQDTSKVSETPRLIAHRARIYDLPENTLAAVSAAASVADAVELDIRRCANGDIIVFHDKKLNRATNKSGLVSEKNCSEVLNAEVHDSGETIPKLEEVLDVIPPEMGIILDIKEPGLASDIGGLLKSTSQNIVISSQRKDILEEFQIYDSKLRTAYVIEESWVNKGLRPFIPGSPSWLYAPEDTTKMVQTAMKLGCSAIHPRYELCLQTELVDKAHEAGLLVQPWTTNSITQIKRLAAIGADGVICDISHSIADYYRNSEQK